MMKPKLVVEGKDDEHVVGHLLLRHGLVDQTSPIDIVDAESDHGVLMLAAEVKTSIGRSVGLVIDADEDVESRVESLCNRLKDVVDIDKDEFIKCGSFVQKRKDCEGQSVGGWIMPGKGRTGKLEDFLQDLIPADDKMLDVATNAVSSAKEVGAPFPEKDEMKALIHVWLGLQECPGKPMGLAVKCKYFDSKTDMAVAFVDWVRSVFSLSLS